MTNYTGPDYDRCRKYIRTMHEKGVDWTFIRFITTKPNKANQSNLMDQLEERVYEGWPTFEIGEWFDFFDKTKTDIEEFEARGMDGWAGVAVGENNGLDMSPIYDDPNSCWNRYKYKLLNVSNFSENTVKSIEKECDWIVRNLKPDTSESVKGLVVGNVQSGKTANMAGVMAMAADLGYNFFIVLSGMITNLREQTAKRLYSDLALIDNVADPKLAMAWQVLTNLNPKCQVPERLSSLKLSPIINGERNPNRYLTVCLKNKKRLRDLLGWLQMQDSLEKTGQLKVVIIDDECDQAGVNTADIPAGEQTRIFQLIKGLCDHGRPAPHDKVGPGERYKASNYIAYSATPYANILNDGDANTSLFPRDFICSLPMSLSYWGPSRYFSESPSDDEDAGQYPFINEITQQDLENIKAIHKKQTKDAPRSLMDAVIWFLCAGVVRRLSGSCKPVSMLVHTSNKTCDHESVAAVISKFLDSCRERCETDQTNVLDQFEVVYNSQLTKLSIEDFNALFPDYEPKAGDEVVAPPKFSELKDELLLILQQKIAHIQLADEEGGHAFDYERGVHLCVDNSANNGVIAGEAGEEFTLRIKYPEEGQMVDEAPLFLIVGGNTLSRGLTLEGLVSSYFVRTVRQSDSLMQMGRWFGYRFGYELLPRVWMTRETLAKFCLLNQVDLDLRKSLSEAMESGLPPDQMIPCVRETKDVISGFTLTSPKKMQMAEIAEMDYGGRQQVVVTFDTDDVSLEVNESAAKNFLSGLHGFQSGSVHAPSNYFLGGVDWGSIKDFLQSCHISRHGRDFQNLGLFFAFVEKTLKDLKWTVVVAGTTPSNQDDDFEFSDGLRIGKVGRKVNKKFAGYLAFKHVTAPADFVCDIDYETDCVPGTRPFEVGGTKASIGYYRSHASLHGKDRTPVLVVNCISKSYLNDKCQCDLTRDIFGLAFYLPRTGNGEIVSYTKLRVKNLVQNTDDDGEV